MKLGLLVLSVTLILMPDRVGETYVCLADMANHRISSAFHVEYTCIHDTRYKEW